MERAAKLEARGGASNPNTMASAKSEPVDQASPAPAQPSTATTARPAQAQPHIEDVFEDPKPKKAKVDLELLMRLTDMKRTYQVSKKLCRVQFSLLCGLLFHFAYFAYNVKLCTFQLFLVLLVCLYYGLDWYEDYAFTNPINVSVFVSTFPHTKHFSSRKSRKLGR